MKKSFKPGEKWEDVDGKLIQAHGFDIFFDERLGKYCWVGANHEFSTKEGNIWAYGVKLYTSADLYNWKDEGTIVEPSEDFDSPLHFTYQIDRPHLIYCEKTQKYVLWVHSLENGQFMVIMTADDIHGPYEIVNPCYYPYGFAIGDFSFYQDEETGKTFVLFNRPHFELICAELTDDYLGVSEKYSEHFKGDFPPFTRESPVVFRHDGKKYLITSGTTGYYPNDSTVYEIEDFHGEYKEVCRPMSEDKNGLSYLSQVACVVKAPNGKLVACADRWLNDPDVVKVAKETFELYANHKEWFVFDTAPLVPRALPHVLKKNGFNTCDGTFVFLPIEFENGKPMIRWHDEWSY